MGRRVMRVMAVAGAAILLVATAAMAQPDRGGRGRGDDDREDRSGRQRNVRLRINGREAPELERDARRVPNGVMVPSAPLFQRLGGQQRREKGWVPPGSTQPDRDRAQEWTVIRRGDRDLRFRPGQREYYWGGQRHYFDREPYEYGGHTYISLWDIIRLFGGTYDWDDRYGYGNATLCEYGYCATPDELRLTYPYEGQTVYSNAVHVQGYVAPYRAVRVVIYREAPFTFTSQVVYSNVAQANRAGLFSAWARVPGDGVYRVRVELLDGYGRVISQQSSRFYAR